MVSRPRAISTLEENVSVEHPVERAGDHFNADTFASASASEEHNLIIANVVAEFRAQLKKHPGKVYPSGMRVRIPKTTLCTYPDVLVVSHQPEFDDDHKDTLLNPTLIVEVLAESTERYDRGKKFAHYRRLPSLQEYVLIAQDEHRVEQYTRHEDGKRWVFEEASELGETILLASIDCELTLSEVYDKTD